MKKKSLDISRLPTGIQAVLAHMVDQLAKAPAEAINVHHWIEHLEIEPDANGRLQFVPGNAVFQFIIKRMPTP